jgi:hypothetical protein
VCEAVLDRQVRARIDEFASGRGEHKRVRPAAKGLVVVAVIGDEEVRSPITIEVCENDVACMLGSRHGTDEQLLRHILETACPITRQHNQRMRLSRTAVEELDPDDVRLPVTRHACARCRCGVFGAAVRVADNGCAGAVGWLPGRDRCR